jgi:lipopolysaccharide cholinephosphotransferase
MKKIDIKQVQEILLEIAKEIDLICRKHSIPYYMLGGSMLGAIRHKGFIPWDDDFDIGIPRVHYIRFLEIAEQYLSHPYQLLTYNNDNRVIFGVAKIHNVHTRVDNKSMKEEISKQKGVSVDIFPLDTCEGFGLKFKYVQLLKKIQKQLFTESSNPSFMKTVIRQIIRCLLPLKPSVIPSAIERVITKDNKGSLLGSYWSQYGEKHFMPTEIWGTPTEYEFEGMKFYGPENYDVYLSRLFKDYMKLPPEDKRICHCNNVFLAD